MNKYYKYKNLYLQYKKMFGGTNTSTNDLIGRVNDGSVFYLLNSLDYAVANRSVVYIYWSENFSPFTLSHGKLINKAIDALMKSNSSITQINVYLIPKFNSKSTVVWTDMMTLIELTVKELGKLYKVSKTVSINFYSSDFSQTIYSSIYMYENFASKPDLYLELELFCKLNGINPSQLYYITRPNELISIFTGINQTNTIHLISKYNFITWNKMEPFVDLELATKFTSRQMDLASLQTLLVTEELLDLLFEKNVKNFESKQLEYPDPSLISYDKKRLDFFYGNEIKLNGELDYRTMRLTIEDIALRKRKKLILFVFEEDLDLTSSMIKNGIQFINQNVYPSLINFIASRGLYF